MSRANTVDVLVYTDGQIIEDSNSVRYSTRPSTNMRIRRTITYAELLEKLYTRTRTDQNYFSLKVIIKFEFEKRNVMRESTMEIKDDETLGFFLDPNIVQDTIELYIEKEPIQYQGQDNSLLTQVTSLTPPPFMSYFTQPTVPDLNPQSQSQLMSYFTQPTVPDLNMQTQSNVLGTREYHDFFSSGLGSSTIQDVNQGASTTGHLFGHFLNVPNSPFVPDMQAGPSTQNSPLENSRRRNFVIPNEGAVPSTQSCHDFEHPNFGCSDFANVQNDDIGNDSQSDTDCSLHHLSDRELEENLDNAMMDEGEDAETNVPMNEDVPHTSHEERLHEVISFYSTTYPEVEGDSLHRESSGLSRRIIYDHAKGNLRLGQVFDNKLSLQAAVKDYHVQHARREFKVTISNSTVYAVECKNGCRFKLRGSLKKSTNFWKITRYEGSHECFFEDCSKNHFNLDINMIANEILPEVRKDPSYKVGLIKLTVQKKWKFDISYGKAWYSLRRANDIIYGTWEDSVTRLPKFFGAIQKWNPGTVVEWRHKIPDQNPKMLKFMFWAFKPCIDGFRHCRRVICVDGTHLYARHKAKLLCASTLDGNQNILPLAFAIVDNESNESWLWFLQLICKHFLMPDEGVCLISDRHKGLLNATRFMPAFSPPLGAHRYCLRHVSSNFNAQFKSKVMKELCYAAGMAHNVRKFDQAMELIGNKDPAALNYLKVIPQEKWTLAYDGGMREGIMTTNMGESLNNVLKGTRHLPPASIVECTFHRIVEYFADRVRMALAMRAQPFTTYALKMFNEWAKKSQNHKAEVYSWLHYTGAVKTPRQIGSGNHHYAVDIKAKYCSCGKWSLHRIPCSHAMKLCTEIGLRPTEYVEKYYLSSEYLKTYQGRFYPLLESHYWDTPNFELVHDPNLKKAPIVGRQRSTRIPNEMDWRDLDSD